MNSSYEDTASIPDGTVFVDRYPDSESMYVKRGGRCFELVPNGECEPPGIWGPFRAIGSVGGTQA